jgi:hypothetical protein
MSNIISLTDHKIKKILGNMSDIVINDRKRERLLSDTVKIKEKVNE